MKYKKHLIVFGVVALIAYVVYGLTERTSLQYVDASSGRIKNVQSNRFFTYSEKIKDSTLTLEARRCGIEFPPERWVLTNESIFFFKHNPSSHTGSVGLLSEVLNFRGLLMVCDFKDSDEDKRKLIELFLEWMRRGDYQDYEKTPSRIYERCGEERAARRAVDNPSDEEQADSTSQVADEIDSDEAFRRFNAYFLSAFERSLYPEEEEKTAP